MHGRNLRAAGSGAAEEEEEAEGVAGGGGQGRGAALRLPTEPGAQRLVPGDTETMSLRGNRRVRRMWRFRRRA